MKYKYRGLAKNRLTKGVHKTRWYSTYKEAHNRAESLGNRVYGKNNYSWEVDVIIIEEGKKPL